MLIPPPASPTSADRALTIYAVSLFEPDTNTGAAGTIAAVGQAWGRLGHRVSFGWREHRPGGRAADELVLFPRVLLRQIRRHLADHPDTDVVIASQPYAYRAFRALRRKYPRTLFVNRTHGWEGRYSAAQNRYGWGPPAGPGGAALRVVAQAVRAWTCRQAATAAHGVVAACGGDAAWVRAAYRLPAWRVAAIPYGIDPDELPPSRPRPADGPLRLIYAGQYLQRKGAGVLEKVLSPLAGYHPNVRLTFVVPRAAVQEVERVYRPAWGDRLTVGGWVPRAQLVEAFGEHDVLLFPTYFEGYGKVAVEALAAGCVVAGFAEGVLADLASPACLTRPVGDAAGFAELLETIAAGRIDPRRLSAAAVRDGRRRTWDDTARDTIDFFRDLRTRYRLDPAGDHGSSIRNTAATAR